MLFGRDQECARIEGLLDAARAGHGDVLVLRGEAGIGKSVLLHYAVDRAAGMRVLTTRGIESEGELAFSGLLEAVRPLLAHVDDLPQRQAVALRRAFAIEAGEASNRFTIGAALLGLLAVAAQQQPLLAVVDDVQWLDSASADALTFAARRLYHEPVAVLFAVREGDGRPLDAAGLPHIVLEGLEPAAAEQLLVASAGHNIAPEIRTRLVELTRGNPLGLLELPAVLSPAQLAGTEPLPDPLPAGGSIAYSFARRAAQLGGRARGALLVAAASISEDVRVIAPALAALGLEVGALDPAEDAGLIRIEDGSVSFRHPLVRSAMYGTAPASRRRGAHRALADAAAAVGDEDQCVWHLAAATVSPDEAVAQRLEAAALRARGRSGYGAAASAYERAARLTPDEAPRLRRLHAAADAAWLAGRTDLARTLLAEAIERCRDQHLRAEMLALLGHIEHHSGRAMVAYDLLEEAAGLAAVGDPAKAITMLADAFECCLYATDVPRALATARRLDSLAGRDGGMQEFFANFILGCGLMLDGQSDAGAAMLRRSVTILRSNDVLLHSPRHLSWAGVASWWLGDPDSGWELVQRAIQTARERGALGLLPYALRFVARYERMRGRWPEAYAAASEAAMIARETGQASELCGALTVLASIDAGRGDEEACLVHAGEALNLATTLDLGWYGAWAERALALSALGWGRLDEAAERLGRLHVTLSRRGVHGPGISPVADLVETLVRQGRLDDARALLATVDASGDRVDAPITRCRALVAGNDDVDVLFTSALTGSGATTDRFERARTQLCYGERLRRQGQRRRAREELRAALETFEELGARPWADRARAELRASGERLRRGGPAPGQELTPQELRIATLVAEGRTNREVAAALFLSAKTVEFHLGAVYRKLGLRSRTELVRLFAEDAAWRARQDPQPVDQRGELRPAE